MENETTDILHSGSLEGLDNYKVFRRRYPAKSSLPVRFITDWYIQEIPMPGKMFSKWICLVGIYKDSLIRTSPVTSIISSKRICTCNCIYVLGPSSKVTQNSLLGIENQFIEGFPENWESLVEKAFIDATLQPEKKCSVNNSINNIEIGKNIELSDNIEAIDNISIDKPLNINTAMKEIINNNVVDAQKEIVEPKIEFKPKNEYFNADMDYKIQKNIVVKETVHEDSNIKMQNNMLNDEETIHNINELLNNKTSHDLSSEFENYDDSLMDVPIKKPEKQHKPVEKEKKYSTVEDFIVKHSPFKLPKANLSNSVDKIKQSSSIGMQDSSFEQSIKNFLKESANNIDDDNKTHLSMDAVCSYKPETPLITTNNNFSIENSPRKSVGIETAESSCAANNSTLPISNQNPVRSALNDESFDEYFDKIKSFYFDQPLPKMSVDSPEISSAKTFNNDNSNVDFNSYLKPDVGEIDQGLPIKSPDCSTPIKKPSIAANESNIKKSSIAANESNIKKASIAANESNIKKASIAANESNIKKPSIAVNEPNIKKSSIAVNESNIKKASISANESNIKKPSIAANESNIKKISIAANESNIKKASIAVNESNIKKSSIAANESIIKESLLSPAKKPLPVSEEKFNIGIDDISNMPIKPSPIENTTIEPVNNIDIKPLIKRPSVKISIKSSPLKPTVEAASFLDDLDSIDNDIQNASLIDRPGSIVKDTSFKSISEDNLADTIESIKRSKKNSVIIDEIANDTVISESNKNTPADIEPKLPMKIISSIENITASVESSANKSFAKSKKKKNMLVMPKKLKSLTKKTSKK